ILRAIRYMFPSLHVTAADVESSWAGLRPLIASGEGKKPGEISRKDEMFLSDSNLISIAGGKLTGYRKMAEQVVDLIVKQIKKEHLPISGGEVGGAKGFAAFITDKTKEGVNIGLSEKEARQLVSMYGSNVDILFDIILNRKTEAEKERMDLVVFAQLIYGIEYEFVYTPADFFIRRTGALFYDINGVEEQMTAVIHHMPKAVDRTDEQKTTYTDQLSQSLRQAKINASQS